MKLIAAKEAKNNFGELIDTAQREPVTIERQGRAIAVIMSVNEYEKIKLERLRAKLVIGADQADRGEFSTKTKDDIINEGKEKFNTKNKYL